MLTPTPYHFIDYQDMRKNILYLRTVALMTTVVLLGGFAIPGASAKTIKNTKTTKTSAMNAPDFAYPKTVEKNASAALEKATAVGDWPAAVEASIQMLTADNIVSRKNVVNGIAKIDSVAGMAPDSWRPAFGLIKADIYVALWQICHAKPTAKLSQDALASPLGNNFKRNML